MERFNCFACIAAFILLCCTCNVILTVHVCCVHNLVAAVFLKGSCESKVNTVKRLYFTNHIFCELASICEICFQRKLCHCHVICKLPYVQDSNGAVQVFRKLPVHCQILMMLSRFVCRRKISSAIYKVLGLHQQNKRQKSSIINTT